MSDEKIGGVKNVQNYDVVVKDVNYDSENEKWDDKNPPQIFIKDSDDSSD